MPIGVLFSAQIVAIGFPGADRFDIINPELAKLEYPSVFFWRIGHPDLGICPLGQAANLFGQPAPAANFHSATQDRMLPGRGFKNNRTFFRSGQSSRKHQWTRELVQAIL